MTWSLDTAELVTLRLRLRRYRASDRPAFVALSGDPEVNRHVEGGALEPAEASALFERIFDVYAQRRFAVWAVDDRHSARYLGHAELKPRDGEPGLELVYLLERGSWGCGLGTELARALRDHALRDLAASRALATIDPRNEASLRVLCKLGFRFAREWMEPGDDVPTCLWLAD